MIESGGKKDSKQALRKIFRNRREALSTKEVLDRSEKINQNFLANLLPKIYAKNDDKIFSLYLDSNNEVSTKIIADFFQKNQIKFSYPKIIAKNQALEFIACDHETSLFASEFYPNIFEPKNGKKVLPDFLIIPLVAFDLNLSRIGMGGGFFDRTIEFLKKQKSQIVTIGLAFDFQESKELLPLENTDCGLDFIVTEKNIFLPTHNQRGLGQ